MIKSICTLLLFTFIGLSIGCKASVSTTGAPKNASSKNKKVPPGQAKKVNGDKSARKYAPGHN